MSVEFDFSELTKFEKNLLDLAENKMPKETKRFLRNEGAKLKRKTLSVAKSKVKENTGNYFKSIKRGKVYKYKGNQALSIRVYSNAPHAHLIEEPHRQVTKDGQEIGFVKGKKVFETAKKGFESKYYSDTKNFLDEVLDKGL